MRRVVADRIRAIVAGRASLADLRTADATAANSLMHPRETGRWDASASLIRLSADPVGTLSGTRSHGSSPARFNPLERVGCEA